MRQKLYSFKNRLLMAVVCAFTCIVFMNSAHGPIRAGEGGRTGAPFDSTNCASCHSGGIYVATLNVTLETSGGTVVTSYVAGTSYILHIKVLGAVSTLVKYGFQTVCVDSATYGNIAGWGTVPPNTHDTIWNSRNYVEQTASLTSGNILLPWTAPASGTGTVKFFTGACIVNGNLLPTGDNAYNDSLLITENTVGCIPATLTTTITGVTCYGASTGGVNLAATGGTGAIGFSWTGPSSYTATTQNISGVPAGDYTVVVTAAGGCTDTTTALITQAATAVSVTPTSNSPVCPGDTIRLSSNGAGGTLPYYFTWTGPAGFTSALTNPNIPAATATDTGLYTVLLSDNYGCQATGSIHVSLAPVPADSLIADTTMCIGTPINLNAGDAGDTFLWNTLAITQVISITDTGIYSVKVTNSFGCVTNDTVHVSLHCTSGINNITDNNFQVYPVPASGNLTISVNENEKIDKILVFNATGTNVAKLEHVNIAVYLLNTEELADGLYTLQVYTNKTIYTTRITVNR